MSKVFEMRKQHLTRIARDYDQKSPVMRLQGIDAWGDEWRCVVEFDVMTLVLLPDGQVTTGGPVLVGIRYHERFLSEAPHPFSIATILAPANIHHPNCAANGAMCMGHPPINPSIESIYNQIWAGLNLNLKVANTIPGDIANARAAEYVRTNASRFPLSPKGLFEPKDPS